MTRILITAGPTIEDIDPVRFISNRASGTLGCALAQAAASAGMEVTLVHGPISEVLLNAVSSSVKRVPVRSASQMLDAVMKHVQSTDVVIMNAAVADYTPAKLSETKLKKSGDGLVLKLKATVDILKRLGEIKASRKKNLVLIGFALETGEGRTAKARARSAIEFARKKLASKNLDAIVLNSPATIGADTGDFLFLSEDDAVPLPGTKAEFARALIKRVTAIC